MRRRCHGPAPAACSTDHVRVGRWLWDFLLELIEQYRKDELGDVAAAITFWTILTVPAAALALVSALGPIESILGADVVADLRDEIETFVATTFADSGAFDSTIESLFSGSGGGTLTFGFVLAVLTLNRGFGALIRGLDRVYQIDRGRPWWYSRIVAIGLGLGTLVVVAGIATAIAVFPNVFGTGAITTLFGTVALIAWAATVFHLAPNHRTPWRYDLPGAVLTGLGWLLATRIFAIYVQVWPASGNQVQTSVGAVLLALTLMYVLNVVLLVGAETNDILARRAGVGEELPHIIERARRLIRR